MSTTISAIVPSRRGCCNCCGTRDPLYSVTFTEEWSPDFVQEICARCIKILDDSSEGVEIPDHPAENRT